MSTKVYFTNIPNPVTGVSGSPQLLTIGTRGAIASTSSISLATTNTTANATTTNMTFSPAGAIAFWISRPLSAAVTVSGTIGINHWASATAVAALANVDWQIFKYSSTLAVIGSTAVATSSINVHPYVAATRFFVTLAPTSTAFAIGDRIAILGNINPATAIPGAGQGVNLEYNGQTQGADGDSWIEFNEDIQTTTAQAPQRAGGPSLGVLEDLRTGIAAQASFAGQYYSPDARLTDVVNELAAQRDLTEA